MAGDVVGGTGFATRRLEKEHRDIQASPVDCLRVVNRRDMSAPAGSTTGNREFVSEWTLEITGAPETLYVSESYTLRFRFPFNYPLDSPEVMFVSTPPVHPHVYSNGHICLSILYDAWSPALGVSAICLSLISMLSSCKHKARPVDDSTYTMLCPNEVSPKQMKWIFHDDAV
eukprot:Lankesteria_metandrocarpae@DN3078_c0_g2_i1.p1